MSWFVSSPKTSSAAFGGPEGPLSASASFFSSVKEDIIEVQQEADKVFRKEPRHDKSVVMESLSISAGQARRLLSDTNISMDGTGSSSEAGIPSGVRSPLNVLHSENDFVVSPKIIMLLSR